MEFTPRLTAPARTNKWYCTTASGGYNKYSARDGNCTLANCTAYAYGRFMECTGSTSCNLPVIGAYQWFTSNHGYPKGLEPKLGAVICWGNSPGHVGIVEQIFSDGSIKISESYLRNDYKPEFIKFSKVAKFGNKGYHIVGEGGKIGWTYTKYGYQFQGFIYNPGVTGTTVSPISANADYDTSSIATGPLYTMANTSKDAIIREVGYFDGTTCQPSIKSTDVKLSVINYTPVLGALASVFGYSGSTITDDGAILDNVAEVPRKIIEFFKQRGLNTAAGVGICGNVQAECGFNITQSVRDSDGYIAGGMCMWNDHYKNYSKMIQYIAREFPGSDWRHNLTAQCSYLYYDITQQQAAYFQQRTAKHQGQNIPFFEYLKQIPNTLAGAREAAVAFMKVYENPGNWAKQSVKRANFAEGIWNQIAIAQSSGSSGGVNLMETR